MCIRNYALMLKYKVIQKNKKNPTLPMINYGLLCYTTLSRKKGFTNTVEFVHFKLATKSMFLLLSVLLHTIHLLYPIVP